MKNPEKIKQGKKSREAGARFERKVRADLEKKGWIVDRWSNQVEFEAGPGRDMGEGYKLIENIGKLVKAKSFMGRTRSNGFPDFVVFRKWGLKDDDTFTYNVHGVEVKSNGKLSKTEKEKVQWLLKNKIFGRVFIAEKFGSEINYKEYTHSERAVK